MQRVNIRVLVSMFCIIFSCLLTIGYLFIAEDDDTQTIASATTKATEAIVVSNKNTKSVGDEETSKKENIEDKKTENIESEITTQDVSVETTEEIVYDGMTLNELASKLDHSLKNELSSKGGLYASYCLEKGVDPYLAVAISLEETGCNGNCSTLVKTCNNVGGMKGTGCGSYGYFNTIDDGIKAFIDNISRNYVAYGLTTADLMNSKYAENTAWSTNVNNYIIIIKNN